MKSKRSNGSKIRNYVVLAAILVAVVSVVSLVMLGDKVENMSEEIQKSEVEGNIAVLETSKGTIKIELFLDQSPVTAGNFKKLVSEGFYDGTRFHRVIRNFMIQGGDPNSKDVNAASSWGTGGPGYAIKDEFVEGLSNVRGTISMANSGPNSGGSQFFINVVDNSNLDWDKQPSSSKHPVFGKIVEGMNVVDEIANAQTGAFDRPSEDVVIGKASME